MQKEMRNMSKSILLVAVLILLSVQACVATVSGDPSKSKREQVENADKADAELNYNTR